MILKYFETEKKHLKRINCHATHCLVKEDIHELINTLKYPETKTTFYELLQCFPLPHQLEYDHGYPF